MAAGNVVQFPSKESARRRRRRSLVRHAPTGSDASDYARLGRLLLRLDEQGLRCVDVAAAAIIRGRLPDRRAEWVGPQQLTAAGTHGSAIREKLQWLDAEQLQIIEFIAACMLQPALARG
jgi:hypothetical protein